MLTWWQGQDVGGHGAGEYVIDDNTYHQIATARAGNGYSADLHDLAITPQNTALLLAYAPVAADLTAFGGSAQGTVLELVVQEVDIATGAVLLEWHGLDHVPLSKGLGKPPGNPALAWDYMHGNGIALDTDGNILVTARNTSAVYKINRTTGALMWTLGRGGDFTANGFADSDWFSDQHDVRRRSDGTLSVFDNGNGPGSPRTYSRGLALSVDETNKTASIVKIRRGPGDPQATSQGDFRELPGGDDILGWGNVGQLTEVDAAGNVRLDMKYPDGVQSYRSVRFDWHGHPSTRPTMVVDHPQPGTTRVAVSWNGATDVAHWLVAAGPDLADLSNVASSARTGFETTITVHTTQPAIEVIALDAHGTTLGSTATGPALPPPDHTGYFLARTNGSVRGFGTRDSFANATVPAGDHVVGLATATTGGYWIATAHGDVIPVDTAGHGTLRGTALHRPIVGIAGTPDGRGYWLVASDGGIFAFGTARFYGSAAYTPLKSPIVGISPTRDGRGYWLVASDGGIFSYGTARFYGSAAYTPLRSPIVGISATVDGHGYWLVGADGGIFSFGTARFHGSTAHMRLRSPIVGATATHDAAGIGSSVPTVASSRSDRRSSAAV